MNVLVIGSGGREHALTWALAASPLLETLYCAPGNAGIAEVARCVKLDVADPQAVVAFCREAKIALVVVGPEAPLVGGMADVLTAARIKVFGPSRAAARLEGSKGFTKDLCRECAIPTAAYARFANPADALAYLRRQPLPIVVKADGLAAGKGVAIAATQGEAERAVEACFAGAFGPAGAEIVIEEFLEGEEASFFALVDGKDALALATAQDHKRVGDGDTGPNTGGMGAYSPAPVMTEAMARRTMDEIIRPTVAGMARRGTPFKGVLFLGVMITRDGPKLYEYNVRFGDPECQALMLRLKSDLLTALLATVDGTLANIDLRWRADAALAVVMASKGYPGSYQAGSEIRGLDLARAVDGVTIFHAGTHREGDRLIASGGRVLNVAALGKTVAEAQQRAYAAIARIDWPGGFWRCDIGWRAVARERAPAT
jgi:phosphoribosylamine--glycine ligase